MDIDREKNGEEGGGKVVGWRDRGRVEKRERENGEEEEEEDEVGRERETTDQNNRLQRAGVWCSVVGI